MKNLTKTLLYYAEYEAFELANDHISDRVFRQVDIWDDVLDKVWLRVSEEVYNAAKWHIKRSRIKSK